MGRCQRSKEAEEARAAPKAVEVKEELTVMETKLATQEVDSHARH